MFGKRLDGLAAGFILHQRVEVFLGIAAGEVEQVGVLEIGNFGFGVEECDVSELVDYFLIDEGERLGVAGDDCLFAAFIVSGLK